MATSQTIEQGASSSSADRDLAQQIVAGDAHALEVFYQRYFTRLYRFVYYQVGGSHDDAQDVLQDALIAALKSTNCVAKADVLKPALLKTEINVPIGPFKFSPGRVAMTQLTVAEIVKTGNNYDWKILKPMPAEAPYLTTFP